jgi:hypothetical protein
MQHDIDRSLLAPEHAFVIQFHANTDVETGPMTGRIEHVVSGQATHFDSLEALLSFIARVLREVRHPSPESHT